MKKSLDKKNALKAFEYALIAFNIEPDNPDILKWYVITLGKKVEDDTIRNQIEQSKNIKNIALTVIDLLPNDEFCYSIMGQWHYKLADLGRASRRVASILFSEPPKGSFEEAQYFFEKSLEINPDYIGTYYWLGKTYLKLNQEQKAIELFKEIGANGFLGQAYLSLGLLYKASKRTDPARQYILEAIELFQECEAEGWLKQANEALDSLV